MKKSEILLDIEQTLVEKLGEIFDFSEIDYEYDKFIRITFSFFHSNKKFYGVWSNRTKKLIDFQNKVVHILNKLKLKPIYLKFDEEYCLKTNSGFIFVSEYEPQEPFPIDYYKFNKFNNELIEVECSELKTFLEEYYKITYLETLMGENPKLMYCNNIKNVNISEDFSEIFFSNLDGFYLVDEKFKFCPAFVLTCSSNVKFSQEFLEKYCEIYGLDKFKFVSDLLVFCILMKRIRNISLYVNLIKKIEILKDNYGI